MEKEERAHGAVATVTAPEMTGDLLNAALS